MDTAKIFELQKSQNIPSTTTIEVPLNVVGQQAFKFPTNSNLEKKTIIGLFVTFPSDTVTTARSGKPLLVIEQMNGSFLTLSDNDKDFIKNAPLAMFNVAGKPLLYVPITTECLNITNCEIALPQKVTAETYASLIGGGPTTSAAADNVIQLTFVHL